LNAQFFENLQSEKCDLAFVVLFVVEEAVAANAARGDALELRDFNHRMRACRLAVVPEEVVARRNVAVENFDLVVHTK
jgi:hypothetical protein